MKDRTILVVLVILAVVVLTPVALILLGGVSLCQLTSALANPPTRVPAPTATEVVKTGPLVIQSIRTQAKLETVVMSVVNDQDVVRVSGIGGICTEHITYLGYYDVTAGVDLSKITADNIAVTNDGFPELATVTITVPPAEILNVTLDTQNSRLVAQDTPTWIPGCETQVADMTLEAQQRIREYAEMAAVERGILQMSQEKAGFELQRLLMGAGYENVTIQYSSPYTPGLQSP